MYTSLLKPGSLKEVLTSRNNQREGPVYLQVHLIEADQHAGDEALPESCWNETHLKLALDSVAGMLAEAVDIHGWFGRQQVWQEITREMEIQMKCVMK